MPASRSRSPMRRPRRSRPALRATDKMRRQGLTSLIVFVEINCFRRGDPQHCAGQGVQLPVATARAGKLTSAALRGLATTG